MGGVVACPKYDNMLQFSSLLVSVVPKTHEKTQGLAVVVFWEVLGRSALSLSVG